MKHITFFIFLIVLFSCNPINSIGQREKKISNKAQKLYQESAEYLFKGAPQNAIIKLEQALKIEPEYYQALDALAQIYQTQKKDLNKAITIQERIISFKPNSIKTYYNKALCEFKLQKLTESKKTINIFLSFKEVRGENRLMGEQILKNISFTTKNKNTISDITFKNLGKNINTSQDEYFPSITSDNQFLYYTVKESANRYATEDIYFSEFKNNDWSYKKSLSTNINTQYNEGAHCISSNGKYLLFSSDNHTNESMGRFDIFISKKVGNNWKLPNNLGRNINSTVWDSQPVLSADSKTIFFVSTRKGGVGDSDIYYSTIDETGSFGEAQNIGEMINTPFDEQRPYLHPDGKTLYFSSAGHPGFGSNDFFKSTLNANGQWSMPINLGNPINTPEAELGIFVSADGNTAYISSDREGGFGGQDLYKFDLPKEFKPNLVSYLKGKVLDGLSKKAIKANIKLYDIVSGKIYKTFSSDELNGNFLETIEGGKDYALEAISEGYLPFSENISLKDIKVNEAFVFNVNLSKIEKGNEITLKNVFFNSEKFDLLESSKIELKNLVAFLQENNSLNIEIGGHTDNSGSSSTNEILSNKRAKSVMDFLITNGIDSNRLSSKGFGDSKPVDSNDTEKGKANNRRTTILIL